MLGLFFGDQLQEAEWPEETEEELDFREKLTKALGHIDIDFFKERLKTNEKIEELQEEITLLKTKIELLEKAAEEKPEVYKNKTEGLVMELRKKALGMPRRNGEVFIDSIEARHFLEFEIRADLSIKNVANPRDRTIKTMREIQKRFPKEFKINKAGYHYRKIRLVAIL